MSRKFVALTIFFSFLVLFLSSFVLYVIPGGQTGASGWSFTALHRGQWIDLHITSGFLFLAFGLWHTALNWRGLLAGFKKAARISLKSSWPVWAALALNIFIVAGTLNHIQPIEGILTVYKEAKQQFRTGYAGDPPREINLEMFGDFHKAGDLGQPEESLAAASFSKKRNKTPPKILERFVDKPALVP